MSYADRVERIQPSLTLKINAEAAAIQADRRGGDAVARLGAGEPDFETPDGVKRAAHQAIDRGFTHYTAVDGYDGLKQAVRKKFRRDNNLHFQDDQVLVTCGAKQALYDLCQTLLRPGDEAVVPRPYWVTYPAQVTLAEAQTVYLDLDAEDGYLPRAERLNAALTDATRLVFLNSPITPPGASMTATLWKPWPRSCGVTRVCSLSVTTSMNISTGPASRSAICSMWRRIWPTAASSLTACPKPTP